MKKSNWKVRSLAYLLAVFSSLCCVNAVLPCTRISVQASESEETYGDFTYRVSPSGTVTLTKYQGSEKSLVIPSSIEGKNVTSVGSSVLTSADMDEVIIPKGVETIEPWAFNRACTIKKVIVQGKDTWIGENAFPKNMDITVVCSSDSMAYQYARENRIKVELTDGISLTKAAVTVGKTRISAAEAENWEIPVTVRMGEKTLKEGVDYTVSRPTYEERNRVGTKTVTVTAKEYNSGYYTGSVSVTYDVVPTASSDLSATKKISTSSIQLIWSKVDGATGYQIYRYDTVLRKYRLLKDIPRRTTNTYTDRGLKKNTAYRYRVVAYQRVGGKLYSAAATELKAYTSSGTKVVRSTKRVKLKNVSLKLKAKVSTEGYIQDKCAVVSSISDFFDSKGRYTIAYSDSKYVYISIMNNSTLKPLKTLKIRKRYEMLGSVIGGPDGYYYIVWGPERAIKGAVNLEVTKYNPNGKFVKSCKSYNKGANHETIKPFEAGNCAVAFQGNILVCSYARLMGNGHQSNGVFCVNTKDMTQTTDYYNYVSHSFDQKLLVRSNGDVVFANLGDAYPRGFDLAESGKAHSWGTVPFHFYGDEGLNWTRARLGGIGQVSTGIVLVGSSAMSMTAKNKKENQQLFIQIVNPVTGESILDGSKRSGTAGGYSYTDKGVKWLTNYKNGYVTASDVAIMENDRILVLWEKYSGKLESYYMVLSPTGKILQTATRIGQINLNECEEIKYKNGCIYWTTATKDKGATVHKLYIGKFQ